MTKPTALFLGLGLALLPSGKTCANGSVISTATGDFRSGLAWYLEELAERGEAHR
jgi:hypothetical protein